MKKVIPPVLGLILMAIFTTVQESMTDNHIDSQEWVQVAIQATMVAHVWATANLPQYTKMKFLVAGVIAVLQALYTFVVGGVDTPEIINMIITFLAALGVAFVKQPLTKVINGQTVPPNAPALNA